MFTLGSMVLALTFTMRKYPGKSMYSKKALFGLHVLETQFRTGLGLPTAYRHAWSCWISGPGGRGQENDLCYG